MPDILTARNITKSYSLSSGTYPVLNNINLSLEKGLSYSLIGRSGSGKSTLLHILSGLDTPDSGSVYIKTNICIPLFLDGIRPDTCFFQEITDILGLTHVLHRFPAELSGGEQQRAAIARALITKPYIIFADEPTGNLDKQTAEATTQLLFLCMKKFGQTLFLATHDLNLARKTDHIFHLENGDIL